MTDIVTRDSSHQHERGSNKLGPERLRMGVGGGDSWKGSALEGPDVCAVARDRFHSWLQAFVPRLFQFLVLDAWSTCLTSLCPSFLIL